MNRTSFSIEIFKCETYNNPNCKSDEEIESLLSYIFFTLYYVGESLQFSNQENYGGSPVFTDAIFH